MIEIRYSTIFMSIAKATYLSTQLKEKNGKGFRLMDMKILVLIQLLLSLNHLSKKLKMERNEISKTTFSSLEGGQLDLMVN